MAVRPGALAAACAAERNIARVGEMSCMLLTGVMAKWRIVTNAYICYDDIMLRQVNLE